MKGKEGDGCLNMAALSVSIANEITGGGVLVDFFFLFSLLLSIASDIKKKVRFVHSYVKPY